jgi:hypothetical protein
LRKWKKLWKIVKGQTVLWNIFKIQYSLDLIIRIYTKAIEWQKARFMEFLQKEKMNKLMHILNKLLIIEILKSKTKMQYNFI